MQDLSRRLDSSRAELGDKVGEHAQQVTAMLDLHKASMGAAFDSHKVVVADATQQSVQIFDDVGRLGLGRGPKHAHH